MRIGYKLTDANGQTYNGFQWEPGTWVETDGDGPLCTEHWTHWYDSPELAAFLNPIHAKIATPICWRGETDGKFREDRGLKYGATRGRIIERVPLPEITTEQRVEIGIHAALMVENSGAFRLWAERWLSGVDRSSAAAWAAAAAAWVVWAVWAAERAAWAAEAAAGADKLPLNDIVCSVLEAREK